MSLYVNGEFYIELRCRINLSVHKNVVAWLYPDILAFLYLVIYYYYTLRSFKISNIHKVILLDRSNKWGCMVPHMEHIREDEIYIQNFCQKTWREEATCGLSMILKWVLRKVEYAEV
jgi:hypothetical protein